jgi:hypothetical protein
MSVTIKKLLAILAIFTAALPFARADVAPATTDELVAELKAQRQKNAEDAASLQSKLDEAYSQLEMTRKQSERAVTAVIVTALITGGVVAAVLVFFIVGKGRQQHQLVVMNEKLDKQWKDLCKANEELARVNKDLSESLAKLTGKKA